MGVEISTETLMPITTDTPLHKIWFTFPFSNKGIIEATAIGEPSEYKISVQTDSGIWHYYNYPEGIWWHKNRKDAVEKAKEYRHNRLVEAASALAKLQELPEIR